MEAPGRFCTNCGVPTPEMVRARFQNHVASEIPSRQALADGRPRVDGPEGQSAEDRSESPLYDMPHASTKGYRAGNSWVGRLTGSGQIVPPHGAGMGRADISSSASTRGPVGIQYRRRQRWTSRLRRIRNLFTLGQRSVHLQASDVGALELRASRMFTEIDSGCVVPPHIPRDHALDRDSASMLPLSRPWSTMRAADGEVSYCRAAATLCQPRVVERRYVRGTRSLPNSHKTGTLRHHVAGTRGDVVIRAEWGAVTEGALFLTSLRLVHVGPKGSKSIPLDRVRSWDLTPEGLVVNGLGRPYNHLFLLREVGDRQNFSHYLASLLGPAGQPSSG